MRMERNNGAEEIVFVCFLCQHSLKHIDINVKVVILSSMILFNLLEVTKCNAVAHIHHWALLKLYLGLGGSFDLTIYSCIVVGTERGNTNFQKCFKTGILY